MPKTPIRHDRAVKFKLPDSLLRELTDHLAAERDRIGRPQPRARWLRRAIRNQMARDRMARDRHEV